jgi:hypothetical protein
MEEGGGECVQGGSSGGVLSSPTQAGAVGVRPKFETELLGLSLGSAIGHSSRG